MLELIKSEAMECSVGLLTQENCRIQEILKLEILMK